LFISRGGVVKQLAAVFALILILLVVFFLPDIFSSLHAMQLSTTTQSGNITTTGNTTGNITLSEELYRDSISSVTGLTSTNTNDTPYAVSYSEITQALSVSGLQASSSRVLSAEYEYITPGTISNMGAVATFLSIVIVLGLLILFVVIPGGTIADLAARFRS
jgi:hypothetical protein